MCQEGENNYERYIRFYIYYLFNYWFNYSPTGGMKRRITYDGHQREGY